jgi:UDP-glucose 4-epimerase
MASVVEETAVAALFDEFSFDFVFHLAAYAAEGLSHFIKSFNYHNNLLGSVNLINACINKGTVKCFVFTSSIAVYGSNQLPMREDLVPEPEDPYGIAKLAVERELRISHGMFGLPYIVFRPHNVYGERQNLGDRYRNVIGIFMNQAMRGEPFTIFGSGHQTRAFSHIADVAPVIAHSVERSQHYGETFNIGADTPYSILELASAVAEAMAVGLELRHLPERFEVEHAYADHSKAQRAFGDLMSGVTLDEGLRRMAQWAKTRGPQDVRSFYRLETTKNLPPAWAEDQAERHSGAAREGLALAS